MPYRDENGHFISEAEARLRDLIHDEPEETGEVEETPTSETPPPGWAVRNGESIFVETGRGESVEVNSGDPFASTIEQIADRAHYGGYYRVFLNGSEIINPSDAPATIESGMRIAVTAYDKVG